MSERCRHGSNKETCFKCYDDPKGDSLYVPIKQDKTIDTLQAEHKIMKDAYASWSSMEDQVPTGRSICQLIESFGSKRIMPA